MGLPQQLWCWRRSVGLFGLVWVGLVGWLVARRGGEESGIHDNPL